MTYRYYAEDSWSYRLLKVERGCMYDAIIYHLYINI